MAPSDSPYSTGILSGATLREWKGDFHTSTLSYPQPKQDQPTMSLYEVYIVNLSTHDVLSELVVADSEAKAHIKAFDQARLSGSSVDDYHFICKRVGDVPSGDE